MDALLWATYFFISRFFGKFEVDFLTIKILLSFFKQFLIRDTKYN